MAVNSYFSGELVRVSVVIQVGGVDTDPTTLTLKVTDPEGNATSYTYAGGQVIKDSTGHYRFDIDTTAFKGTWYYRWEGTGTGQGATEGSFIVQTGNF